MRSGSISRRDIDEASETRRAIRELADRAFFRAAGAPLRTGNDVRLLKNAQENYPAWLAAIGSARRTIDFECYIIHDDEVGRLFANALVARARTGVRVRLIYDWIGALGAASRRFWNGLRDGGVQVRCYNPPRLDSPFGWISRDHRKTLSVDGEVAFVAGLCVGRMWVGDPERGLAPWRDTGVMMRGPAVDDVEDAFEQVWRAAGRPPSADAILRRVAGASADAGTGVRVVATVPSTAKMLRLDQLVASLARARLWISDAYYAGAAPYVQTLRCAAMDGVDVRLLVPGATDIPVMRPISRVGYRPLLDAGIRVFEWNGSMMHAKTAVADGQWARVGSSNLNPASWLGNCELDVVVDDVAFARQMEEAYEEDLRNSTEIVLDPRSRIRPIASREAAPRDDAGRKAGGSAGRAAAAALRVGNAFTAAVSDSRVLEPVEARVLTTLGVLLLGLAILAWWYPRSIAYTVAAVAGWTALALIYRGATLARRQRVGAAASRHVA